MGARAAVALGRHLCVKEEVDIQGVLCVSFPLHPPGQTHVHVKRSEDLRALSHIPVLFVSGTVDNMCERVSLVYGNSLIKFGVCLLSDFQFTQGVNYNIR